MASPGFGKRYWSASKIAVVIASERGATERAPFARLNIAFLSDQPQTFLWGTAGLVLHITFLLIKRP
jgi:hypothetical protein